MLSENALTTFQAAAPQKSKKITYTQNALAQL
jgi:hypothetical protein